MQGEIFLLDLFVHGDGIVLTDIICHLYHLYSHRAGAHSDFDPVAYLDLVTGLYHPAIDADASIVAGFVGYRPTLDQPGDLQILVKTHSGFLLSDDVLQSLAGLENGQAGSGDLDGLLGPGIAANASFALLCLEDAEAGDLDLVALNQSGLDGLEGSVDDALCVLLGHAGLLGNCCDDFGLVHSYRPLFIKV